LKETLSTLTSKNLIKLQEQTLGLGFKSVTKYMKIYKKLLSAIFFHAIDLSEK